MGYTTDFTGQFEIMPSLSKEHKDYLNSFSDTRRMKRNEDKTNSLEDPIRKAVELPVGTEGEFYVGDNDYSIEEFNEPPVTQPGLWCQWIPNEDGTAIEWDNNEKFYHYIEWLNYIIDNFITPWGYKLNDSIQWQGENSDDIGKITVNNNKVIVGHGKILYEY